jgi:hypothetical protein
MDTALKVDAKDIDETAIAGMYLTADHHDRKTDERRITHNHVFEAMLEVQGTRLKRLRPPGRHLPHGHLNRHAGAPQYANTSVVRTVSAGA